MSEIADGLRRGRCVPCEGGIAPLDPEQIRPLVAGLPGWQVVAGLLSRTFTFTNYYETMAFVNAVAWLSHREDHHPDLAVGYRECRVGYITHAIGGLSNNDFICAAKVDSLFDL